MVFGGGTQRLQMKATSRPAALGTAVLLAANLALAQPRPPSDADALFRQARALLSQQKYAEACTLLEKSHQLEPALGTLLNLADCLEKSGRPASAFIAFNEAATWAARQKESKREEVALQRAQALKGKLARVTVELASPVTAAVAQIYPAGTSAKASAPLKQWSLDGSAQAIPLDPGKYEVRVEAPQCKPATVAFEIPAMSGVTRVAVPALERLPTLAPEPVSTATGAAPAVSPSLVKRVDRPSRSPAAVVGVVNVAAGGALVVGSTVALVYSRGVINRVERQQSGGPDEANPTVTRGEFTTVQTLYPAAWVGLGVGIAALGTGTYLLIRDAREPVTVSGWVTPSESFVTVRGSF